MEQVLVWAHDEPFASELARVDRDEGTGALSAAGVAIGVDPLPYLLEYRLEAGPGLAPSALSVATSGDGWSRELELSLHPDGWHVEASWEGDVHLPDPGGDPNTLHAATDVDLARSPLFASIPVLRGSLLSDPPPGPLALVAVWVSVPSLAVRAARQRYRPLGGSRVAFESLESAYAAEVTFGPDGYVADYPGLARRRSQ